MKTRDKAAGSGLFRWLIVALVAAMLAGLAGCGGAGDTVSKPEEDTGNADQKADVGEPDEGGPDVEQELPAAPKVKLLSVTPKTGPEDGGSLAKLTGVGFVNGARVFFGAAEAGNVVVESLYLITCLVPPGEVGVVDVKVMLPDDQSDVLEAAFTYQKAEHKDLTVASILPESGPETGGFLCQLTGTGFAAGISVRLGVNTATSVAVLSDNALTFIAPAGLPGKADVVVKLGDANAVLPDGFEYLKTEEKDALTLSGISPSSGPEKGGALALITGKGFEEGVQVQFGTETASVLEVSSANSMTVEVPAGKAGKVDVVATLGEEVAILAGGYLYVTGEQVEPLSLAAIQPDSGPVEGGFLCVLTGTGFAPGMQISLGDEDVIFANVLSPEVVSFLAPPSEAGTVDVKAVLAEQEAVLAGAFTYVSQEELSIVSIAPDSGPVAGGTVCLIKGSGFSAGASVYIGGKKAEVLDVPSSGSLVVTTPAADGPGAVDVTVTDEAGGNAVLADGFTYTDAVMLKLSKIEPNEGDAAGGFLAMLWGAGFQAGLAVDFCGTAGMDVHVLSADAAAVTVPAGEPGTCDVQVQNPDGATATLQGGFLYKTEEVITQGPSAGLVTPKKGPVEGGTWTLVSGQSFAVGATVRFDQADADKVVRVDATKLLALTPPSPPGFADVTVANPDGKTSTLANAFQFMVGGTVPLTLESISPASGPVTGGTMAILTGENFKPGMSVYVGYVPAASVKYVSDKAVTVKTPVGDVGPADVVAVNPDGATAILAGGFSFFEPQTAGTPPPNVVGVFPPYGPAEGGETVTISGANFQQGLVAFMDGIPVEVEDIQGDTLIKVATPPHAAGSVDVAVANPDGQTSVLAGAYVYFVSPPFIGSVAPDNGPTTGGNQVTVTGSGFVAGLKVFWDGKLIPGLIVTPPDEIKFVAPAHAEGLVSLSVINPDGLTATLNDAYLYEKPQVVPPPEILMISPSHGPAAGGYQVIISGTGFASGATVKFGAAASPQVDFLSEQVVMAVVPKGAAGEWVAVTVRNLDAQEDTVADGFLYDEAEAAPLSIISVTPATGPTTGGTSVAVVGSGFIAGVTELYFGKGAAKAVNVISDAVLTATAPAGSAGPADVSVKNPGETQTLAAGFLYYDPQPQVEPPIITGITPSAGPEEGGTLVQIAGLSFKDGADVLFGGEPALSVSFNSATLLLAETPPQAPGTVSVVVANPDGLAAIMSTAFTYFGDTTAKPPVVAGVVPDFGSALGGDIVTVAGANFAAGLSVYFCGAPAKDIVVTSAAQLTCRVPAGPVGKCDVEIVNPDGLNGLLPDGFTYKAPQPVLNTIVPSQGPTAGGIEVVLYGKNFMTGMEAWFGVSKSASVTLFDDVTASALVPPGLPGKVDVKIVNPGGLSSTLPKAFEYSLNPVIVPPPKVTALIPSSGPVAGGTVVNVLGQDFQLGIKVMFGGVPAGNVTFIAAGSLLVLTPPGPVGKTDVTVLNPDGQGVTVKGGFEYVVPTNPAPKLFGVVPAFGPQAGGTTIMVTGANLTGDGMLYIAMKPVTQFAFLNSSVISGTTPPGTPGTAAVSFVAGDGQEATLPNGYTYIPAPKIDSLSPKIGPVAGGTEVTIVGQNFQPQAQVLFGTKPAASLVVDNSLIMHAVTPAVGGPGAVDVTVINGDGQKYMAKDAFTYLLAPVLNSLAPVTGPAEGGTPVSIWGANFVSGIEVTFGAAKATGVSLVNAGLLLCNAPPGAEGVVDVGVKNPDGQTAKLPKAFTYIPPGGYQPALASIAPASGPASGGTLVTLSGEHLDKPGLILMGNAPVTVFVSVSETAVVYETPVAQPGKVDVSFISTGGKSAILPGAYTYIKDSEMLGPPEIYTVNPASGPTAGNTVVTLAGKDFQDGAIVFFGNKKSPGVTYVSGTELSALTPPYAAGVVDVTVLNPDGQLDVVASAFTFVPPPTISSVDPDSGSPQGGTKLTIVGTGYFFGVLPSERTKVHICTDFAAQVGCEKVLDSAVSELTGAKIVFTTPAHVPGYVDVGVVNPDGQKAFLGGSYYFNEPPVLDAISPLSGPAKGGTQVTITGTGFQAGIKVKFADAASADVTLLSETKILAVTPAGPHGLVDVTVENPDGTVDALGDAFQYIAAPHIDKVYPTSGPEEGGTQVTVEGTYFVKGPPKSKVFFGAAEVPAADVNVVGETIIVVKTPAGKGPVGVKVENPDGQTHTLGQAFVYVPPSLPPTITYVIPGFGTATGGFVVSVIGTGFMEGAQLYFGKAGAWTAATNPTVKNLGTMLSAIAPPHDPGKVDVRVVNTNQQEVTAANAFEYTAPQQLPPLGFTAITPNRAPLDGGTKCTISGKGFKAGIKVYFGKDPDWLEGIDTQYIGPTILQTTAPASASGAAGLVDLMLLNPSAPGNPDKVVAAGAFGYTSGGVFVVSGQRLPMDERNDMSAEAADYNNDGLMDVAVMRSGGNARGEVFINSEDPDWGFGGWFVKSCDLTDWVDPQPYHAHGDFDGDGDIDIVQRRSDRMSLERNKGDGTFGPAEDKGWISWEARGFNVADFNCDGYLDIFVGTYSTATDRPNRILVNDGKGNFTHYTTPTLPAHYELTNRSAAADVDLDGDVDLLVGNGSAQQKRLYYNNCNNKDYPPICANQMCTNHTFGGHSYAVCEDTRTWASAKDYCEANGYYMAVVNDAAEQTFLNSKTPNSQYWMGYSDQDQEGKWVWYGDNSTYTYWGGGQPDNAGNVEDCGAFRWWTDGRWNDANCAENRRYICETTLKYCTPWAFKDAQYGVGGNFPIVGFDTQDIALVDLDLNGYPDAVVANWGQQIRVYMNYGGNFMSDDNAHWPQNEANPNVARLFPTDIENDGDIDFIASVDSSGWRWLRVYKSDLMNGGIGAFTEVAGAVPARRSETLEFAVGDYDGDMLPDIYVVNKNYQDQLLMNNGFAGNIDWVDSTRVGEGKFAFNTVYGYPEYFHDLMDIQAGDIDGDGDADLIRALWAVKRLYVYINDGTGEFADESTARMPQTDQLMYTERNDLVLSDLDGDGDLDVAVGGYKGCDWNAANEVSRIRVFLNDGKGYYTEKTSGNVPFGSDHCYLFLAANDINKDGKKDLFAGGRYWCYDGDPSYQRFLVLVNGGDPFANGSVYFFDLTSAWFPSPTFGASDGALIDLDKDGDTDLYMGRGNATHQNRLYYNDGTKLVDVTGTHLPSIADDTRRVLATDFDGDADLDVYAVNWGQDRLHLQEVDHKFADATASNMPSDNTQSYDAVYEDFDGDNMQDVFIINWDQKNQLFLNGGNGKMQDKSVNLPWDRDLGRGAAVADFDGDGDMDVYVGNSGLDRIYVNVTD